MPNPDCERSCPFVRVCDGMIAEGNARLAAVAANDVEMLIADVWAIEATGETVQDLPSDQPAKADQLSVEHALKRARLKELGAQALAEIGEMQRSTQWMSEEAQKTCSGPQERKQYWLFGRTIVICTGKGAKIFYTKEQKKYR